MSITIHPYRWGGWEVDIRVVSPDGARHARERKRAPMSSRSATQRWAESLERLIEVARAQDARTHLIVLLGGEAGLRVGHAPGADALDASIWQRQYLYCPTLMCCR